MLRIVSLVFVLAMLAVAPPAGAGPWASLPDAVSRLRVDPFDPEAAAVVAAAEVSLETEAAAGRLSAVSVLMEVFESLVMRLDDGDERLSRVQRRVAAALVDFGARQRPTDLRAAATAWTLGAGLSPGGEELELLREVLLPPAEASHGDVWQAPVDGADLVYLAPSRVRVGCADQDRRCRQNEVLFRWVEVPGLWIETTEVTNDRYRLCVVAGVCSRPQDESRFLNRLRGLEPVVGLTWQQAKTYARWAGRRLPTEAEWERAGRGSNIRWRFPWGTARRPEFARVLADEATRGSGPRAVGSFAANPDGIHDLAGNVWEWCQDRYQEGFRDLPTDGSPQNTGVGRVVRGGSWRRTIDMARISARSWFDEWYSADDVGMRCVSGPTGEISDATVLATARGAFALRREPGRELFGAQLSAEDRRYLERRTITWLVLEERVGEAALQAEVLLRRDPRDPAALELLDLVEAELAAEAQAGNLEVVEKLHISYRRTVGSDPQFVRRFELANRRLLSAFRICGETFARDGNRDQARRCFEEGLRIAANDRELRQGLASLEPRPGEVRKWEGDDREMAWVPAGSYRRGASEGDRQAAPDEFPVREIRVKGFWMDRHEVTNDEYRRCVEARACTVPRNSGAYEDPARGNNPVLWVSWIQARRYAEWAGKRLPRETEWEWAARAGVATRYPWGNNWIASLANGFGLEGRDRFNADAPVGSFPANTWGIHDLIGNAAEYIQDTYHPSYEGAPTDGRPWEQETGPIAERQRVVRGGSFLDPPPRLRLSHRGSRREANPQRAIGFRCVAD